MANCLAPSADPIFHPVEYSTRLPKLKMISPWQTGYDNIDLAAADEHGVIVSNVPNYAFDSVAEFTLALALNLMRKVHSADMNLRKGNFDWRYLIGNEQAIL